MHDGAGSDNQLTHSTQGPGPALHTVLYPRRRELLENIQD